MRYCTECGNPDTDYHYDFTSHGVLNVEEADEETVKR